MERASRWLALRNVSWAGLEAVSSVLVSFVAMLGIARLIGAAEFGLGALAIGITQMLSVILGSLFHDALVRNPDLTKRHFDSAWTATLLLSGLALLICILLAHPLAHFFDEQRFAAVFIVMAITMIPDSAVVTLIAERRRELDFRLVTLQFLAARLAGALAGVACAFFGLGVWSMIVQQWLTALLGPVILLYFGPYRPQIRLRLADLRPMILFTSSIIATQFVIQFAQRLMLIYVARIGDITLAGYWGLADRLIDALQKTITNALYHVSLSHFALVQSEPARLGKLVRQANAWLAALIMPGLALIAITGPEIIDVLMGDDWAPAGPPMQMLAVGVMVQLRRLMDHVALNAMGRSEIAFMAYGLEAALTLSALLIIGPVTLVGIAVLRAAQPLAGFGLIVLKAVRRTKRKLLIEAGEIGRDLLLTAMVGGTVWWTHGQIAPSMEPVLALIVSTLIALAATMIAIALFRPSLLSLAWSLLRVRTKAA